MASYPTSAKSFTTKVSGADIDASHINDLQSEVAAIETGLLNGTARLNSSNSTVAALSVTGRSTLASLSVTGVSTLASLSVPGGSTLSSLHLTGNMGCTGTIASSSARIKTLWVNQLDASSGAGGVLSLLGRTAASSGSVAVAITPTVNRLLVVWNGIQTDTDDNGSQLRLSVGGSIIASGYASLNYSAYEGGTAFIWGSGTGLTGVDLSTYGTSNQGLGNATGEESSGYVWVVQGASNVESITGAATYINPNGVLIHNHISGWIDLAGAITAINIVPESGNLDSGEVAVYEVAVS